MNSRGLQFWLSVTVALAFGLALRLWYIHHVPRVTGDTLIYGDIAKNWLQHGVYGLSDYTQGAVRLHPTIIRLPGYPIFLAIAFRLFGMEHYTAVMYAQTAIDLLGCLILAALAGRLFGRRAALAVLWLAVLCPFISNYVAAPLTETLSLFCITLAFYALERWRAAGADFNSWLWIISAALGYAILLRPEQGLLAAAIVPAMLWIALRQRPARAGILQSAIPVLIACLCIVLPLLPWTIRNYRTFHLFQPLAPRYATDPGETVPFGFQRWYRTWAIDYADTENIYWNYDTVDLDIKLLPPRAFDSPAQQALTRDLILDYNQTDNATPAFDARRDAIAQDRIRAHPFSYHVLLPVARLFDMVFRPRTEMLGLPTQWWQWNQHPKQSAQVLALGVINFIYFALGACGLWRWKRSGWREHAPLAVAMIAFILLRCALLLTLDNSEQRYTLEFYPILLVWSGAIFTRFRNV
jgi:hypothetical protein